MAEGRDTADLPVSSELRCFSDALALQHKIHSLRAKVSLLQNHTYCSITQPTRQVAALHYYSSNASLSLFPDFQQRLSVLQHLGYIEGAEG